ncbi:type IVB secretion system protein IcmW [Paucibacter soli]|uniref:type IVB secretion system protein IcmW n=1 Tax=Paucibacter soli TaxID=3133433 RepID=UPI0030AA14A2
MNHPLPQSAQHARVLDLSAAGVQRHWLAQGVEKLINAMERCEPWAIDVRPEYRARAEQLVALVSSSFNRASSTRVTESVTRDPGVTIEFMGYLRSGRALALFAWLTQVHPDIPRHLVDQARFGDEGFGSILVERITTLERQHLLSRVFSPERIAYVIELLAEAGYTND